MTDEGRETPAPDAPRGDALHGAAARDAAEAYRRMFDGHDRERVRRAGWAAAIAGALTDHFRPRSVVDIGCGLGFFLAAMGGRGADRLTGVDADWVEGLPTEIPRDRYLLHDLETPLPDLGRHDLAACLEVAEHLGAARGPSLVAELTALSDVVLFSAAIPGQGGRGHVNCRWQSYWAGLFAEHGHACYDPYRRRLAAMPDMAPWFAQNLLLFVREGGAVPDGIAPHRIAPQAADMVLPLVHTRLLRARERRFRAAVRQLEAAGLRFVPPGAAGGPDT
ncbi:MAG: hypothetical protein HLUCCA09_02155 [Rhodobacteraceae bacterium HLUCCA09]|nr:MAG: hypothetical protein HLUCCA09_02155 [Rhodobacteraceae bacterium HLUCCA09]